MRATFLQFRNPKEKTPSGYYPESTTEGRRLFNRCAKFKESESVAGTFSRGTRFNSLGSIYKDVVDRTDQSVGPGTYREIDNITKKPCMTTLHKPEVALASTEEYFDIQGHLRLLQTSYMPKKERTEYE